MVLVYHGVPVGCDAFLSGGCSLLQASSSCGSYLGDQVLVGDGGSGAAGVGEGMKDVDVEAEGSVVGTRCASAGVGGSGVLGDSVGPQHDEVLLAMEDGGASRMWGVVLLVSEVLAVDMRGLWMQGAYYGSLYEAWV